MSKSGKKILLVFANGLGDAFMTFPTIRALFSITDNISLMANNPFLFSEFRFRNIYPLEPLEVPGAIVITDSFLEKVKDKYDYMISLCTYHSVEFEKIAAHCGVTEKLGFSSDFYDFCLDSPDNNLFDQYFNAAKYFNNSLCIEQYATHITPDARQFDTITDLKNGFNIISIHTDTRHDKEWTYDNFVELINKIIEYDNHALIVIIGKPRFDFTYLSDKVVQFPNDQSVFELSWHILSISDFYIGIDSCFMHLADINRVPGIAIFGPTNDVEFGFRFNKNACLIKPGDCITSSVSVEEVFTTFTHLYLSN